MVGRVARRRRRVALNRRAPGPPPFRPNDGGGVATDLSPEYLRRDVLDERIDPGETASARGLRSAYRAALGEVVEAVGPERAARESGVDAGKLAGLGSAGGAEFTLREAAAILALSEGWPDAATVERELRDDLLVGMSNAAVDAAELARDAGTRLDAAGIRSAVEDDRDLPLSAYARLRHHLAAEVPA